MTDFKRLAEIERDIRERSDPAFQDELLWLVALARRALEAEAAPDEVEAATIAILANLQLTPSNGGEHGCIIEAVSPDRNVIIRGHVWIDELARVAIEAATANRCARAEDVDALKARGAELEEQNAHLRLFQDGAYS